MELLFELVFDGLEVVLEILVWLIDTVLRLVGWLCEGLRRGLEQLPDRDFSQLSVLGKAGRLLLAGSVSLPLLVPLVWLVFR